MQRLLIVDDETIICDGLHEIISREQTLDIDIYKCYSSLDAVKLLQQYRFDILLTDIQMPGMNGLQLADFTRNKWPKCRIIFLTGHHEFDYVYSAINYERVNYILKTEGYDKVINAVKFAIEDILKVKELDNYIEHQQIEQRKEVKHLFLSELAGGCLLKSDVNEEVFKELNINLQAADPLLILISEYTLHNNEMLFTERAKTRYELKLIAENYFNEFPIKTEVLIWRNEIVWLLQADIDLDTQVLINIVKNHLDTLQDTLHKHSNIEMSFVLDKEVINWVQLASRIEELKVLFQYKYRRDDRHLILSTQYMNDEQSELLTLTKQGASLNKIKQLEKLLQQLEQLQFEQKLDEILEQMIHVEQSNISEEIYLHTAMVYFTYINKWNIADEVNKKNSIAELLHFKLHDSRLAAAQYLRRLGKKILSIQLEAQDKRGVTTIEKLQHYINEHIFSPDQLTLVHLSEISYFNTSYLSRLFKQVTGQNLSEYIVEVKMFHAEQLLKDGQNKIQDIAEKLGYSNATNFTRVFKKQYNMTPQDFRFKNSIQPL